MWRVALCPVCGLRMLLRMTGRHGAAPPLPFMFNDSDVDVDDDGSLAMIRRRLSGARFCFWRRCTAAPHFGGSTTAQPLPSTRRPDGPRPSTKEFLKRWRVFSTSPFQRSCLLSCCRRRSIPPQLPPRGDAGSERGACAYNLVRALRATDVAWRPLKRAPSTTELLKRWRVFRPAPFKGGVC